MKKKMKVRRMKNKDRIIQKGEKEIERKYLVASFGYLYYNGRDRRVCESLDPRV